MFVAAGFNPRSHSARLVQAVRDGRLRMIWDDAIREETEHVMRQIPPLSWTRVAGLFRAEDRSAVRRILRRTTLCLIQPTESSPRSPRPSRRR